jgi:pimeloyl-ACP methyl ester carboxylesterase
MNIFKHIFKLAAIGLAAATLAHPAAASPADPVSPTVVLVHGAFADGSDWAKVIPLLQDSGLQVVAVQSPLSSLGDDVAAAKRAIDTQPGKVVLVGHSWGGTVVTQVGDHPKVAALVYVAAYAPDVGQATGELGKGFPTPSGLAHLKPDTTGWFKLTDEGMRRHFAQDLPAATTAVMAATQSPIYGGTFSQKVSTAAWKIRPSWYLVAESDRMLPPEQQRAMAKAINAQVRSVDSSHVPQQSQPSKVAEVILEAVRGIK